MAGKAVVISAQTSVQIEHLPAPTIGSVATEVTWKIERGWLSETVPTTLESGERIVPKSFTAYFVDGWPKWIQLVGPRTVVRGHDVTVTYHEDQWHKIPTRILVAVGMFDPDQWHDALREANL